MSRSRNVWLRRICWVLAVILVAAMLYVFIAPSLNLAPSALRALRAALVVLICLRLWRYVGTVGPSMTTFQSGNVNRSRRDLARGCLEGDLQDLYCARLC
jgi:cobalamin biosynthesis protein CobD/CbiB